jgi:peptide/nickel transport system substrate-binding protein
MTRMPQRVLIGLATVLLWAATPAVARDQLIIGTTQFPSTLHPSIDSMLAKSYVLGLTQRPFTTYDQNWELVCLLCTELPTIENGKAKIEDLPPGFKRDPGTTFCKSADPALATKGMAVTYTIQPNATWGDGTPVTTDDVMFTYEVGKNEKTGFSNSELYRRIVSIDVLDKKTFTIHGDRVDFGYNGINDFQLIPAHLERAALGDDPAEYHNRTLYNADPTNPGLWFGPYRVTSIEPGTQIVLDANPTWWGEKPQIKRIVIKTIDNTSALEANLLSGAIDYIAGENGLSIDEAIAFEERHRDAYDVLYKPVLFFEHVTPNHDDPALGDKRVRQALLYALGREALSQQLFGGRQPVADSDVSPLDWIHTDEVRRYQHDPGQAAALLDAAGWKLGPDGLRHDSAGKPLRFELMTTAGDRTRELVEQVLQSQWKTIGVDVRIKNEPARVLFGETITKRKFTGLALFAWLSSPENVPHTTLHSTMVPTEANGWAGQNYADYRNPELDDLMDCIEIELDRNKREQMWHKLQAIYAEELPDLPLYFRAQAFIMPKWLKGVRPTGHQYQSTLWAEQWRIEE